MTLVAQGQSASITINDSSTAPLATYSLYSNTPSVNEGLPAVFTLITTNLPVGSTVPYTLSGVNSSDISSGQLSGSVIIGSNGQATISVPTAVHATNLGNKNLTVTVNGVSASQTLIDTAPLPSTYNLNPLAASVNAGAMANFTLSTTNVPSGTTVW